MKANKGHMSSVTKKSMKNVQKLRRISGIRKLGNKISASLVAGIVAAALIMSFSACNEQTPLQSQDDAKSGTLSKITGDAYYPQYAEMLLCSTSSVISNVIDYEMMFLSLRLPRSAAMATVREKVARTKITAITSNRSLMNVDKRGKNFILYLHHFSRYAVACSR